MGAHLVDNEFQSDKYPTTPRGKVPLSCKDASAQDLLWEYAQRRRVVDPEFSNDLEQALILASFVPPSLWKHVTRQTQYTILDSATAQSAEPICEGEVVEIYQEEYGDRKLHIRRKSEFHDGRFAIVSMSTKASNT